jgi:hypothetical protein
MLRMSAVQKSDGVSSGWLGGRCEGFEQRGRVDLSPGRGSRSQSAMARDRLLFATAVLEQAAAVGGVEAVAVVAASRSGFVGSGVGPDAGSVPMPSLGVAPAPAIARESLRSAAIGVVLRSRRCEPQPIAVMHTQQQHSTNKVAAVSVSVQLAVVTLAFMVTPCRAYCRG